MMYNPNLMYCIYPIVANRQDIMETFFVNMLWKDHCVNQGNRDGAYIINGKHHFHVMSANNIRRTRNSSEQIYATYDLNIGHTNKVPLWMFGLLY